MAENLNTLWEARLAAQKEFPEIPKDRENTFFKSWYSTLDAIIKACRPILNKHGIVVDHKTEKVDDQWHEVAYLTLAATGEQHSNPYPLAADFAALSPQARGSEITYGRRYSLAPMLGITSDEDDDGNAASQPKQARQQSKEPLVTDLIAAAKTATDLAALLTKNVGLFPPAQHRDRWYAYGTATVEKLKKMDQWPEAQKALVNAVLDGVRNTLKPPADDAAAAACNSHSTTIVQTPSTFQQQLEALLTPGDLETFIEMATSDNPKAAAVRHNPKLWLDLVSYASEMVHRRMEAGEAQWTLEACTPVGNTLADLKQKAEVNLTTTEAFGGNPIPA